MSDTPGHGLPYRGTDGEGKPPWDLLLHVDWCFRRQAAAHVEGTPAGPSPFPPYHRSVPTMALEVQGWRFHARACDESSSWVAIDYENGTGHHQGSCTVITETRGPLSGRRVVRAAKATSD